MKVRCAVNYMVSTIMDIDLDNRTVNVHGGQMQVLCNVDTHPVSCSDAPAWQRSSEGPETTKQALLIAGSLFLKSLENGNLKIQGVNTLTTNVPKGEA